MNSRQILTAATVLLASLSSWAAVADFNVIPRPAEVNVDNNGDGFVIGRNVKIVAPSHLKKEAAFLRDYLKVLPETGSSGKIELCTRLDSPDPDAYIIKVGHDKVVIDGASESGVFYGVQTIRKALPLDLREKVTLPLGEVSDYPRFAYRGAHLDVVRHFFTVDEVKSFIDMMALHNMNKFHWHLTDDQGWRVEIKKYPRLTEIGSKRAGTLVGRYGVSDEIDSIPVEGYYTRDEIRDIVAYAADRHVEIIPEIDLPSHMMAALASYPELGCTGGPYEVLCSWAGYKDVLCPGKDETMCFIGDVLTEVMDMFPSKFIHIGGDECPKDRWKECLDCQRRIEQLDIVATDKASAETQLQGYVTRYAADVARRAGKSVIGWDEILECDDIPSDAVVMSWRGIDGAVEGTGRGHRVIQTPNSYLYFDFYQSDDMDKEPLAIGGYTPVKRVYEFEPLCEEMSEAQKALVMGPQANLWTEYVPTFAHVRYMELPRMAALSEVQWTQPELKDFHDFKLRLPRLISIYEGEGYNYARHIFDTDVEFKPDRESEALRVVASVYPGTTVRYTLDGTLPTIESPEYSGPLSLRDDCIINAAAFFPDSTCGTVTSDTLRVSETTFGKCILANKPYVPFAFGGADALVDGLVGGDNFRSGRWVGFYGDPCDATVFFNEPKTLSQVSFKTCIVWPEGALEFSKAEVFGSVDGQTFTLLASLDNPQQDPAQGNGAYTHTLDFDPVELKAVRVVITPCAPSGLWKRILFVDEISAR